MDIALNLNSTQNAMDVLKYCALYFDRISVDMPYFIEGVEQIGPADDDGRIPSNIHFTSYCSEAVIAATDFLESEGVVKQSNSALLNAHDFNLLAKNIVGDNLDLLFQAGDFQKKKRSVTFVYDAKLISAEASDAINEILSQNEIDHISTFKFKGFPVPDFYLAMSLYTSLIQLLLSHMSLGDNVVCNSMVVSQMLDNSLSRVKPKWKKGHIKNSAVLNAMKILLPNISNANLEDILEIRLSAKDELIEMRAYIDSTLKELSNDTIFDISPADLERIIGQKITPAVRQFERKLQDSKLVSVQSFIKNIQNPLSYAPLLTSFFSDIPAHITLSASLGLISFETIIELIKNRNSTKNDPLYFTVAMKNRLG